MEHHVGRLKWLCDRAIIDTVIEIGSIPKLITDEIAFHMSKLTDEEIDQWNTTQTIYINRTVNTRYINIMDGTISCDI